MKCIIFVLFLSLFSGCGAVMSPFFIRLDADQQKVVDGMWNNMFTPPARLDRDLLLDVLCQYQVLQMGADRVHITAEKYLTAGKVILDADFDRANADADQMTILALDSAGHTVRRERYSRKEINDRLPEIGAVIKKGVNISIVGDASTQPTKPETPEEKQARLEWEKRAARIQAATQPAVVQ